MATARDLSGNSPIDQAVDAHIGSRNDVPALRPGVTRSGTLTSSSVSVGPFLPTTKYLRLAAPTNQPMYYDVGLAPTAVAGENLLPAGAVETIKIQYPDRIAVLQAGTAGLYTLTEMR